MTNKQGRPQNNIANRQANDMFINVFMIKRYLLHIASHPIFFNVLQFEFAWIFTHAMPCMPSYLLPFDKLAYWLGLVGVWFYFIGSFSLFYYFFPLELLKFHKCLWLFGNEMKWELRVLRWFDIYILFSIFLRLGFDLLFIFIATLRLYN